MTKGDIAIVSMPGSTIDFQTDARDGTNCTIARTIKAGEPVVECVNYVARCDDDDPGAVDTAGSVLMGIAAEESTETTSADGVVPVTMLIAGNTVMRGLASTTTNVDTASDLVNYINDDVAFEASYTVYDSTNEGVISIDEDDDAVANHGLKIIGGSGNSQATLDVVGKARWIYGGGTA